MQVVDFHLVPNKFIKLVDRQRVTIISNSGKEDLELLGIGGGFWFTIEDIQSSFRRLNKGVEIISVDGDWFIKSSSKVKLGKELHTKLGVPETLTVYKPYPLQWKKPPSFLVYSNMVNSHFSYSNNFGSKSIPTPSHLLAVVPSENYPSVLVENYITTRLNNLNLSICIMDGSKISYFGMNKMIITLKLS